MVQSRKERDLGAADRARVDDARSRNLDAVPLPSAGQSTRRWLGALGATLTFGLAADVAVLGSRTAGFRLLQAWAGRAQRALGVELAIEDENPEGYGDPPYVFLWLNQDSLVDSLVCASVLPMPCRLLANLEFAAIPIVGWYPVLDGTPVLVRQSRKLSRLAFAKAVEQARSGDSFCVSVEGFRNPTGGLGVYRKTPILFAIRAQATIVPVFLHGTGERLPFGAWRVRPGPVRARRLRAIPTRGLVDEDRHALHATLRALAEREHAACVEKA